MSDVVIEVPVPLFEQLDAHLATPEQVAFLLAEVDDRRFRAVSLELIVPPDFESRSDYHLSLAEGVGGRLIRIAFQRGLSLVEIHSHGPRGRPKFSPSDRHGFDEWLPHVWWRLKGRPYAAIVKGGDAWDALAWFESPTTPEPVTALLIKDESIGELASGAEAERRISTTGSSIETPCGGARVD